MQCGTGSEVADAAGAEELLDGGGESVVVRELIGGGLMDECDGEGGIAVDQLILPGVPVVGVDPIFRSRGGGAGEREEGGDGEAIAGNGVGDGIVGGETVSVRGEPMIDGVPIVFGVEFAGDEIDGDVEIVEVLEAFDEGGFTGEGVVSGDEGVAGEEDEIDLEFVALTLDELPGGHRGLFDDGEEFGGDTADALPGMIEAELGGVHEA